MPGRSLDTLQQADAYDGESSTASSPSPKSGDKARNSVIKSMNKGKGNEEIPTSELEPLERPESSLSAAMAKLKV